MGRVDNVYAQTRIKSPKEHSRLVSARNHFNRRNFAKAIIILKKILQKNRQNYAAYELLGSSYFHIGLPERALLYLEKAEKNSPTPSYNYYYQGLCHLVLQARNKSIAKLKKAVAYRDLYASNAMFELALLYYHKKRFSKAEIWFTQYIRMFPTGYYVHKAQKALSGLQANRYYKHLSGIKMPNTDVATFKYNPLSAFSFEHFWLLSIGGGYEELHNKEADPDQLGSLKNSASLDYFLDAQASFGFGPFKSTKNIVYTGYNYKQRWLTTPDRVELYMEDLFDFEYFLYRPDLLLRTHEFFLDYERELLPDLSIGAYSKLSFVRMGSSLLTSPEDTEIQKSVSISNSHLIVPWVRSKITNYLDIMLYSYLMKIVNDEAKEFSSKTYELGGDSPAISFGAKGLLEVPKYSLNINLELFQYNYIYNDTWLDSRREGVLLEVQHEIVPSLFVRVNLSGYQDAYLVQRLRAGGCQGQASASDTVRTPSLCWRTDSGSFYSGELFWNFTNFTQFSVKYEFHENKNADLEQNDFNRQIVLFKATMAFPDVSNVIDYTTRYDIKTLFEKEGMR